MRRFTLLLPGENSVTIDETSLTVVPILFVHHFSDYREILPDPIKFSSFK
jgi:hypothetical protein